METKTFWDILKSRKFWVLVLAVVTAAGLLATGEINGWEFLQAIIAAAAAYTAGVAIEDAGLKAGMKGPAAFTLPAQPINLTVGMAEARENSKQGTSGVTSPPA